MELWTQSRYQLKSRPREPMAFTFQLGIYFIVGFIETFLSTQRTYWITQGKSKSASVVVFLESLIYMYIFYQLMTNLGGGSVWIILFYALGNAVGTYINLEKVPF